MRFIVVGCGRVGAQLAYGLSTAGHEVAVIDQSAAAFDNLRADYRGRTAQGDVLAEGVLQRIGIEQADGLAAVTNSDAVNAVVAHVARRFYRVPNVVVRSYAPSWAPLHETFGSQAVSSTTWGAQRIEQLLLRGAARVVLAAGHGEVEVYEISVPAGWAGKHISELLPAECLAIALTRGGRARIPQAENRLEADDVLHVSATAAGMDQLRRRLGGNRGA
jgi:trk system potassium uptake protein TrkA